MIIGDQVILQIKIPKSEIEKLFPTDRWDLVSKESKHEAIKFNAYKYMLAHANFEDEILCQLIAAVKHVANTRE